MEDGIADTPATNAAANLAADPGAGLFGKEKASSYRPFSDCRMNEGRWGRKSVIHHQGLTSHDLAREQRSLQACRQARILITGGKS